VSGPSSNPRGEHAPAPGVTRNTELVSLGEVVVDSDDGESPFGWRDLPTPNRETRRAMKRAARRKQR
jgi:hypothetical protein